MSGFPEKVTKENLSDLVKRAKKIKRRYFWLMLVVGCFYTLIGLFLVIPLVFYLVAWSLRISYPELSTEMLEHALYGISFVSLPFVMYLLLDWMIWSFERFLGLPKSEEKVFAGCFTIANHLMNNEKTKAIQEVNDFVSYLAQFLADIGNKKRKAYSPEFKLLARGKTQIHRMFLFSKVNVSGLFTKFGLSIVRGKDQEAFTNLTELVNEVKKFGKPRGRFSGFIATVKQAKVFLLFITVVMELIIVVLKILGL